MKNKIPFLFCLIITSVVKSQTKSDSLKIVYTNYYQILKSQDSIMRMSNSISNLEKNYNTFNDLLVSNNEKIKNLTKNELFTYESQINQRKNKIINSTEFVKDANVSLNAINQFSATSNYLSRIVSLNNPENDELGFSLSVEVEKILEDKVIKGKSKINGIKSNTLLGFINNIIKSPVTETISTAIPIVSSIKSVIDLVIGTAIQGDDIKINDVVELKNSLKVYIQHYDGLVKCQSEFDQNLSNLEIRKSALVSILYQYTSERINTLTPNSITEKDKIELTDLIREKYSKDLVTDKIRLIINPDPQDYKSQLINNQLIFPDYAVSQAKFIRDEIESLSKEYIAIYKSYQRDLEKVLTRSKVIGNPKNIDAKIIELNQQLIEVEKNLIAGVNIKQLNVAFDKLIKY